jgi:hypothetical protein
VERALAQAEQQGLAVRPEDVEQLWPLGFQHIHLLGRYTFDLAEPLACGEVQPLRDCTDPDDQEVLVAYDRFSGPLLLATQHRRGPADLRWPATRRRPGTRSDLMLMKGPAPGPLLHHCTAMAINVLQWLRYTIAGGSCLITVSSSAVFLLFSVHQMTVIGTCSDAVRWHGGTGRWYCKKW